MAHRYPHPRAYAANHKLATAKFPVDAIVNFRQQALNRPIDVAIEARLLQAFGSGLRRKDPANRIALLASRASVQAMLAHLGVARSEPGVYLSFMDWLRIGNKPAELLAGGHRISAVKKHLHVLRALEEERFWICDIYNDTLPSQLLVGLAIDESLEERSHAQIWAELELLSANSTRKSVHKTADIDRCIAQIFGPRKQSTFSHEQLRRLWIHKPWCEVLSRWLRFPLGQASFDLALFNELLSSCLDDVSGFIAKQHIILRPYLCP